MMEWKVTDVSQNEIILSIDVTEPTAGSEITYRNAGGDEGAEAETLLRAALNSSGGAYGNMISDRFASPIDLDAALTLLVANFELFSVEQTKGVIGEYTLDIPEDALP